MSFLSKKMAGTEETGGDEMAGAAAEQHNPPMGPWWARGLGV